MTDLGLGKRWSFGIYSHIREDAFRLYGFASQDDKKGFLALLKVNGIGPKLALNILSFCKGVGVLGSWVDQEDVKALSSIPKVGLAKAKQICLALKGALPASGEQAQKGLEDMKNGRDFKKFRF